MKAMATLFIGVAVFFHLDIVRAQGYNCEHYMTHEYGSGTDLNVAVSLPEFVLDNFIGWISCRPDYAYDGATGDFAMYLKLGVENGVASSTNYDYASTNNNANLIVTTHRFEQERTINGISYALVMPQYTNVSVTCYCDRAQQLNIPALCFSKEAMVRRRQEEGQQSIPMKHLQIGDWILTDTNRYEQVYGFAHRDRHLRSQFLEIQTKVIPTQHAAVHEATNETLAVDINSATSLKISQEHLLLLANGSYVTAKSVQVGDVLAGVGGSKDNGYKRIVQRITKIEDQGVFAPLTPSGTLVVDGVKVSCYVSLQGHAGHPEFLELFRRNEDGALRWLVPWIQVRLDHHTAMHVFLSPIRLLCTVVSPKLCSMDDDQDGLPWFVRLGLFLFDCFDSQSGDVVRLLLLFAYAATCGSCWAIESLVSRIIQPHAVTNFGLAYSSALAAVAIGYCYVSRRLREHGTKQES